MRGLLGKSLLFCSLSLLLIISGVGHAGVNPFKKSKSYNFGADVAWYENNGAAIKSGSVRDGTDTNYYHLNVDKYRLLLRLGRNDPSGELENTRLLESLAIADVLADGVRLPVFNWCLQNQKNPGSKLKQYAIVANNTCINTGGGGDFIIKLDARTRSMLKKANVLEFVVEPYGRPVKLRYDMAGYASIMAKIDRPTPKKIAPVVNKHVPRSVVKSKPKPKSKLKPKSKPKKVKLCYAQPPADFKSVVKEEAYPCGNTARQASAEKKVLKGVENEKKNKRRVLETEEHERLRAAVKNKRVTDWENRQAALWISRCERHWKKGKSPCYCDKYIKSAPPGITSTCDE